MPRFSSKSKKGKGTKKKETAAVSEFGGLEMELEGPEVEMQSLIKTERDGKRRQLRSTTNGGSSRGKTDDTPSSSSSSSSPSPENGCGVNGSQRKSLLILITLATIVGVFVRSTENVVEKETLGIDGGPSLSDHVEYKKPSPFHSTSGSFGGINNVAHPGGAKAASMGQGIAFEDIIIPKSNVGHAIPSLNRPNIVNLWGHYVHDEHRSPYASHLYNATREELEARQQKHTEKMAKVRQEWGAWDFRDPWDDETEPRSGTRTAADFSGAPFKDLPVEAFPETSWQADERYVTRFLDEAKKLVHRVKEGIYAEYGYGTKDKDGKERDEAFLENRDKLWKIHVWDDAECESGDIVRCGMDFREGIANFQKHVFDALVKKLLHAMMSNDEFYVVLAGHSAAAGHGNDFQQNRIITFHHLMEPVFDKLGVRLISRNMAMGGVGTLQFSLAGGDLYGETDFLEWDSGMTEKGAPTDVFNKQAILSGERMPIILTDKWFDIMTETNGTAWMSRLINGNDQKLFPQTDWENCKSQPYAARWIDEKEKSEKYNAVCWEPRADFTPDKKQKNAPGSQASWHPGNRQHKWSGRKVALIMLEALGVALERWGEAVSSPEEGGGYPLAASHWHVGDSYATVRETLRTHINTLTPEKPLSQCETLFPEFPRICRVQMHGFGAWKPRAHVEYDLLNIIHPAPNGYKPDFSEHNAYDGFDVLPLNQEIPDDEVDAHLIAIATTSPPPDLDHSWIEEASDLTDADGVVNATDLPPPTRRWLHEASEHAFRKGAEVIPPSSNVVVTERKLLPGKQMKPSSSSSSSDNPVLRRKLQNGNDASGAAEAVVPGRGWEFHGWSPVKGFCDGSAQSECKRPADSDCMINGANDNHLDVWGNALSGWLVFTVPKVREGIILARIEWWCGNRGANSITKAWTEVNGGMTTDTTPWNSTGHRAMMAASMSVNEEEDLYRTLANINKDKMVPKDLKFDIAIDGVVVKTMNYKEWTKYAFQEKGQNVCVFPLLNDISMAEKDWDGKPVEVAIRYRSKLQPQTPYCISHVYYA